MFAVEVAQHGRAFAVAQHECHQIEAAGHCLPVVFETEVEHILIKERQFAVGVLGFSDNLSGFLQPTFFKCFGPIKEDYSGIEISTFGLHADVSRVVGNQARPAG